MWLPAWIGLNPVVMKELGDALKQKVEGKELSEDVLDEVHGMVVEWLAGRFAAVKGLKEHLDHLSEVDIESDEE